MDPGFKPRSSGVCSLPLAPEEFKPWVPEHSKNRNSSSDSSVTTCWTHRHSSTRPSSMAPWRPCSLANPAFERLPNSLNIVWTLFMPQFKKGRCMISGLGCHFERRARPTFIFTSGTRAGFQHGPQASYVFYLGVICGFSFLQFVWTAVVLQLARFSVFLQFRFYFSHRLVFWFPFFVQVLQIWLALCGPLGSCHFWWFAPSWAFLSFGSTVPEPFPCSFSWF